MKYIESKKAYGIVLVLVLTFVKVDAQFINSNYKSEPIFFEDFGTSPSIYSEFLPLTLVSPTASTEYNFNPGLIDDGDYHVSNLSNSWSSDDPGTGKAWDWHRAFDHTSKNGLGRMLLVNADYAPNEIFKLDVPNLCENTAYEFSAWHANLSPIDSPLIGNPEHGDVHMPIDITFKIFDQNNNSIAEGGTGPIYGTSYGVGLDWKQSVLAFTTPKGVTSITLVLSNNGKGGFGNDIAIDDISITPSSTDRSVIIDKSGNTWSNKCGSDLTKIKPTIRVLSTSSDLVYQWQASADGKTWNDLPGENKSSIHPVLPSELKTPTTLYYRVKLASTPDNLVNSDCITYSNIYQLRICY